ncbi:ribosome small subunit-dependent GTPase A [Enterococcus sp. LJL120]
MEEKNIGIVIFQGQDIAKILLSTDPVKGKVSGSLRQKLVAPADFPIVGDYVRGRLYDQEAFLIEEILPRKSFLARKVAGNRLDEQGIAANIETVFITTSGNQDLNFSRLDRYLTIVWDSGAIPVLVITKTDLLDAAEITQIEADLHQRFVGVPVILTTSQEDNRKKFAPYLKAHSIAAFIGSSGVGKSTLLNQLLGEQKQVTQSTRLDDDRGRHTTTSRQLFLLANGAMLIDTPGMREISLAAQQSEGFEQQFHEIDALAQQCRFKNCQHLTEPNCAVKKAITTGQLPAEVLKNYQKLQKELAYLQQKEQRQQRRLQKHK